MIVVFQRVREAAVRVGGETVGEIGFGGLLLVGMERDDGEAEVLKAAGKVSSMRVFEDDSGRMNLDAAAASASWLVVSQFTLAASTARGRRPSFDTAMAPDQARPLVEQFAEELERAGHSVARGQFGAQMSVELINEGPVTFVLNF